MIKIDYLKNAVSQKLIADNLEREKNHKSSGKLSAGGLGNPLQHQILHSIGVPKTPVDSYTLAKFKRGRHVEDWLRGVTPNLVDQEKFVEYRNVVGYVDALVDMTNWEITMVKGVIPHEIKSVANSGFKWIKKDGYKRSHILQATLYALALKSDWLVIDYVASDDYRILSFLERTTEYLDEVEEIINDYDKQKAMGVVPVFEAKEKWQENIKYCGFPEFMKLTEKEIDILLKTKYIESYKKLKEGEK